MHEVPFWSHTNMTTFIITSRKRKYICPSSWENERRKKVRRGFCLNLWQFVRVLCKIVQNSKQKTLRYHWMFIVFFLDGKGRDGRGKREVRSFAIASLFYWFWLPPWWVTTLSFNTIILLILLFVMQCMCKSAARKLIGSVLHWLDLYLSFIVNVIMS